MTELTIQKHVFIENNRNMCSQTVFQEFFLRLLDQEFESILFPNTILIKKIFNKKQKPDLMVP